MRKKILLIIFLLIMPFMLTGCGINKKYKGYWCNYKEMATIVVFFEHEHTDKQKDAVEALAASYDNVAATNYITREDYAKEQGVNVDDMDIYDTYVITFSSMDSIGTYAEELGNMKGVRSAEQSYAKSNIKLYNIQNWGKYTFTDSDEATEADLEVGKFRVKNGVITFTPKDSKTATKMLYMKDDHLCGDAECNEIFAKSTETCSGMTQ